MTSRQQNLVHAWEVRAKKAEDKMAAAIKAELAKQAELSKQTEVKHVESDESDELDDESIRKVLKLIKGIKIKHNDDNNQEYDYEEHI